MIPMEEKMRTAIVTGAAGFIGSHVAQKLLDRGEEVVALDNFAPNYNRARKEANLAEYVDQPRCDFVDADIRNEAYMHDLFAVHKFDRVIHLAAMGNVRYSIEHAPEYVDVNVRGTLNLLEAARLSGVRYFVFASTSSVYGNAPIPFVETEPVAQPLAPYPATKIACEVMAHTYHVAFGMKCTGLRFFNVYGPRQSSKGEAGVVAIFLSLLLTGKSPIINGDGMQTRDYVYVGDVVAANLAALESDFVNFIKAFPANPTSLDSSWECSCSARTTPQPSSAP